jgi:hypothetical protein
MEAFIEKTISIATSKYPIDVKLDTPKKMNDNIDAFLETLHHSEIEDIPDDFDLDWIDVLNYINEAYDYTELYVEFPLCKIQLYNQFIYSILKTNQEVFIEIIQNTISEL